MNHTIDPFRELVCHLGDFRRHLLRQPKLGQCCKKNETCLFRKCRRFQSLLHFYLRFYYKTIKLNYRCKIWHFFRIPLKFNMDYGLSIFCWFEPDLALAILAKKKKTKACCCAAAALICAEWNDSGKYADAKNVRLAKKGHNLVGPELRLQEGATLVSHTQTLQATSKEGCDFCTYETSVILSENAVIGLFCWITTSSGYYV